MTQENEEKLMQILCELSCDNISIRKAFTEILDLSNNIGQEQSNTATTPKFIFGEWVLVDKKSSGQIIECYGDSCVVDENGMWNKYDKDRLTKDIRYLTPSEYYEQIKTDEKKNYTSKNQD